MPKKTICEQCSPEANIISAEITKEFVLRFRNDAMNYWGISSTIPRQVAEIVDRVLREVRGEYFEDAANEHDG